ncbi:hypothetical protein, partial [uncultured Cobetia sp.]|uniref:hypothetical protein n=1 Tax=uncultured Cobetia sp. TaxID=410706 RepID=UPI00259249CE
SREKAAGALIAGRLTAGNTEHDNGDPGSPLSSVAEQELPGHYFARRMFPETAFAASLAPETA